MTADRGEDQAAAPLPASVREGARLAREGDLPRLADLAGTARTETRVLRGGETLVEGLCDPQTGDVISGGRACWVVGTLDNVIVGFTAAHLAGEASRPTCHVEAIYVEPPARGVGVGEEMVSVLTAWARERACIAMDAPALPGSRVAKAFFEDNGFITRLLTMRRMLS